MPKFTTYTQSIHSESPYLCTAPCSPHHQRFTHRYPLLTCREPRRSWSWSCLTQAWRTGFWATMSWNGWRWKRLETDPSGTTKPSICWPAWASVWVWATSGAFHTCVRVMEEVSAYFLSRVDLCSNHFPFFMLSPGLMFILVSVLMVSSQWAHCRPLLLIPMPIPNVTDFLSEFASI